MGLMDKLRGELIDIIEWVDDSRHSLVWRFPRYHNQIKHGAQLIVRPGQVAVFVKEGKLADVFEPGRYRLETRNLPLLSTVAGWKYGFDSPFMAEIYFVSTREVTDMKWGTPHPVTLRDADFGAIRIRAFGNYSVRAVDPSRLLEQLVGTDSSFDMDEISELIRAIVVSGFSTAVADAAIPLLDLASNYQVLADEVREAAVNRIDDEYGLDIPQLYVVNISLPAEVEKALDTRSQMAAIGDMNQYREYQYAQAIPLMAEGEAGGIAGAAMGLGVGMKMANQLMGAVGQAGGAISGMTPGPAPGAPPPPPPLVAEWHLVDGGESVGPMTVAQLAQAVVQGRLLPATLVWKDGMANWTAARETAELAPLFGAVPPPIPES
jgi:membrane protease subunit (stomatin/prohibitin family)